MAVEQPAPTKESMVEAIGECDSAFVVSYHTVNDDDGQPVPRAKIQVFNLDAGLLLSTHAIVHNKFHQRLEYMLMDYLRMLQEQLPEKEDNHEGESILDGLVDPAPPGAGSDID